MNKKNTPKAWNGLMYVKGGSYEILRLSEKIRVN